MLKEEIFQAADLCVVGNLNRDVRLAPLEAGVYLFEDGETTVKWTTETVGGGGANSACAAAALGARVGLLAKTGADSLGRRLEETLVRHGVHTHLARSAACATGTSVAVSFTTGHRHFISSLPNNESLAFEDLPSRRWRDTPICSAPTFGSPLPCSQAATNACSSTRGRAA